MTTLRSRAIPLLALLAGACAKSPGFLGPGNLVAVDVPETVDQVRLTWSPGSRCDRYELQVRLEGGRGWGTVDDQIPPGAVGGNLSFADTDPEAATYAFRIRGWRGTEATPWSNEATFFRGVRPATWLLIDYDFPSGPGLGYLRARWDRQSTSADAVRLERRVSEPGGASSAWEALPVAVADTEYDETDLSRWVDGNFYEYRVSYLVGAAASQPRSASSPAARPSAPVDVTAAVSGDAVRLAWRNTSRIATNVTVMRGPRYALPVDLAVLAPSATAYDDLGVAPGLTVYGVQARTGPWSNIVNEVSEPVMVAAAVADPAWGGAVSATGLYLPGAERAARNSAGDLALSNGFVQHPQYAFTLRVPGPSGAETYRSPLGAALYPPGVIFDAQDRPHAVYSEAYATPQCPLHHLWFDGAWQDELIDPDACSLGERFRSVAMDATGALHALWWAGSPTLPRYATNASGPWVVEDVALASPAGAEPTGPIAVDPAGTPGVVVWADGWGALYVARRSASGWAAEIVPDTATTGGSDPVFGLALPGSDGAMVFASRWSGTTTELVLLERDSDGWKAPASLGAFDGLTTELHPAVTPGGSRIALALSGTPVRLLVRDAGWNTVALLPSVYDEIETGFTGGGKWWALDGLGSGGYLGDHPPRPYLLYEEP